MHTLISIKDNFNTHFVGITSATPCHICPSVIEFRDFLNDFYNLKISNKEVMCSLAVFIVQNNYLEIDCFLCYKYFYNSLGFSSSEEWKIFRDDLIDLVKSRQLRKF